MDRVHRLLLPGRIEPGGAGLRDQQRVLAGTVEPDPVALLRAAGRLQALGQMQHFQGRIARQQRLDHRRGRRAQVLQARLQRVGQRRRIQRVGVEAVAEQVAVGQQALGDRVQAGIGAIGDQFEGVALRGQLRAYRLRLPRQRRRVGAGQREQQQPRARAFAEFVEQQFLRGGLGFRHEFAQVTGHLQHVAQPDTGHGQQRQP